MLCRTARCALLLLLFSLCCAWRAFAAPVELEVQAGEIRFDGTIVNVDEAARTLVINVASFTLPNGKSSTLAAPKPKTIVLEADSRMLALSDAGTTVAWNQLQPGTKVIAIGKDAGSGKDMPGRIVAVLLPEEGRSTPAGEGDGGGPASENKGAPLVKAGETRYDGKITGVLSATTFTLSVLASTNAAGETTELFEPQTKTVHVATDTLIRARDESSRKLKMSDLKIGLRVTLVGKDAGTRAVNAREVAVWEDDGGKSRSLGTVAINQQTAIFITRGDEARDGRAYEDAVKAYSQGLRAAMDEDDPSGQAMSHNRLAQMYDNLDQPKRAIESYQKALEIWRRIGNTGSEATTHLNLAGYYMRQNDVKSARRSVETAIRLYGDGNTRALAIAYSRLGSIQAEQDEMDNAITSWQQALNFARQAQERDEEVSVLGHLAVAYAEAKQATKSQEVLEQLIALLPQIADKGEQAHANYIIGLSYRILGEKAKADTYLTQAKEFWEAAGQRDNAATAQKQIDSLNAADAAKTAPAGAIEPA